MNHWIKFKDQIPEDGLNLWVSDGDKVWPELAFSEEIRKNAHNTFWMIRENPKPPEKERHRCRSLDDDSLGDCYEAECGQLYLEARSRYGRMTPWPVKFCCFCGYSIEKK